MENVYLMSIVSVVSGFGASYVYNLISSALTKNELKFLKQEFEEHKDFELRMTNMTREITASVGDTILKGFTEITKNILTENADRYERATDELRNEYKQINSLINNIDKKLDSHIAFHKGMEQKTKE